MSDNLPAKQDAINFSDSSVVQTLKATVAQNLSNEEFALFAQHCKGTGLNPFKKEVWAIKAGNRLQIMTGINGFLAIANSHPLFDGMEVFVDNDERPTKAVCKVYRKDRRYPAEGVALMKEYGRDTPIWKQMPRVMLTKVAKSIALREAFPQELNGMYTAEEMPAEYAEPQAAPVKIADQLAPKATTDTFPVGKYVGKPLSEIPANYLQKVYEDKRGYWELAEQELLRREAVEMQEQGAA